MFVLIIFNTHKFGIFGKHRNSVLLALRYRNFEKHLGIFRNLRHFSQSSISRLGMLGNFVIGLLSHLRARNLGKQGSLVNSLLLMFSSSNSGICGKFFSLLDLHQNLRMCRNSDGRLVILHCTRNISKIGIEGKLTVAFSYGSFKYSSTRLGKVLGITKVLSAWKL